jgi:hypothetical protein
MSNQKVSDGFTFSEPKVKTWINQITGQDDAVVTLCCMRSDVRIDKEFAMKVFGLLPPAESDVATATEDTNKREPAQTLTIPNLICFGRPDSLSQVAIDAKIHFSCLRWLNLQNLIQMPASRLKQSGIQLGKPVKNKNQWFVRPAREDEQVPELKFFHNTIFLLTIWNVGGETTLFIANHPFQPAEVKEIRDTSNKEYLARQEKRKLTEEKTTQTAAQQVVDTVAV